MGLFEALNAYDDAFDETPILFGYSMPDQTLAELLEKAVKRGKPLSEAEIAAAAGKTMAPDDAVI